MKKSRLTELLTRDVDDISKAASCESSRDLEKALFDALVLLQSETASRQSFEKRLFHLKLLRFIQAALAASPASLGVPKRLAEAIRNRVALLGQDATEDVELAAHDVLALLELRQSVPPTIIFAEPMSAERAKQVEEELSKQKTKKGSIKKGFLTKKKPLPAVAFRQLLLSQRRRKKAG
jgi:hypothetical protein